MKKFSVFLFEVERLFVLKDVEKLGFKYVVYGCYVDFSGNIIYVSKDGKLIKFFVVDQVVLK